MRSRRSLACAGFAVLLGASSGAVAAPVAAPVAHPDAVRIVHDLGPGWNLGNTMDAGGNPSDPLADETLWGNPRTSQAMIDQLKAAGFKTLRLPVSWNDHMAPGPGHRIDAAWMKRVEEIARYALDDGMYVIVNVHHTSDSKTGIDWESLTRANEANARETLAALWTQIATHFRHYDHHLIFEVMNEPKVQTGRDRFDWSGTPEAYGVLNRLNGAALAAIRSTGGNNAARLVMLPTYAAAPNEAQVKALVLPADKMIAVSVHAYNPQNFALNDATGPNTTSTFTADGQKEVAAIFARVSARFVKHGVPVVMGEWGAKNKNNLAERIKFASYYAACAKAAGIPTVLWDNGRTGKLDDFGLLDRARLRWTEPRIVAAITGVTPH